MKFTRIRAVKPPTVSHNGDAGIDFYIPESLKREDITVYDGIFSFEQDFHGNLTEFCLHPLGRILIPSGIRVLLEPQNSMLMAANKSGLSSKTGLIYSAEIVDSPYRGELHIGLINCSSKAVTLTAGQKVIQFIHVPIILPTLEEIDSEMYNQLAEVIGSTRGSDGFGSTDNK